MLLRNANKQEIIKAYRKLAQQWHPDNFQSEVDKKEAEKKFIDIASAKEVLTDPGQELTFTLKIFSYDTVNFTLFINQLPILFLFLILKITLTSCNIYSNFKNKT